MLTYKKKSKTEQSFRTLCFQSWVSLYRLGTPGFGQLSPFFRQILSSFVRIDEKHLWSTVFMSLHRNSAAFKSWLQLGHSGTVTHLSWSHTVGFLRSLSFWKLNHQHSLRSLHSGAVFFFFLRTSLLAGFIFYSYQTSLLVTALEKTPNEHDPPSMLHCNLLWKG